MILVGQYDSFPTRRVAITLHHYGLPFTRDTRSIFTDAADIARINPLIRIPALVLDDGEVLIDSSAILDTLDQMAGDTALVPRSGPLRRRILQASALAQGVGEKAGAVVYERHFHPAEHIARDWELRSLVQTSAGLAELERRIGGPWFCGDSLSHADIMVFCTLGYLRLRLPEALPAGRYPGLEALEARVGALPAVQAAPIGADEKMP
jgi:glutathione S-transferase